MPATGKGSKEEKNPEESLAQETPLKTGAGKQLVGMHPKLTAEKPEPQVASLMEQLWDAPYRGPKTYWVMNVGKMAESEDPIIPSGFNVT